MPNPKHRSPGWIAAGLIALAAAAAFGQTDPLVSKSIPLIFADQDELWAVAADGLHYSLIDPFADPISIRNGSLPLVGPARGGLARSASVLLFEAYPKSDSVNVSLIATAARAANGDVKTQKDSLIFLRSKLHNNFITLGAEVSALAMVHDTLIIGGGRAGFALAKLKAEGQGILDADSVGFDALIDSADTSLPAFRCAVNKACAIDGLDAAAKSGEPDSVSALAVDSTGPGSVFLLIGTQSGLRRGLLGGRFFPKVALPAEKDGTAIRIESIYADARNRILWVFSGSEYFFSGDHGLTFHKPPAIAGAATPPASLTGFNPAPQAVNDGDTSFINFNLDRPGLVIFRRDTLTSNPGTGNFGDVVFDAENGLDITRGEGRLTSLALARHNGVTAIAVGSTSKGIFLRRTGPGQTGAWLNVNSLKRLKGGLDEIITFPTLFTGVHAAGDPEYVNIGYRLKKSGRVTITIYNYAMEKVKTLVDGAPRTGGGSRSEKPLEDRWDGRDSSGRPVSFGTYYILVESDQGEKGWGKAIAVRGRNP